MAYLLGIDTGGTYTDAVILDDETDQIIASAKSLTTRPDLALGVRAAIDKAMAQATVTVADIAMTSLSTTLATNALVEGQGGRIAFVAIGFDGGELHRSGLGDAIGDDPVIAVAGGHDHAGGEKTPLDVDALRQGLADLDESITGIAIAGSFAARNPAHERAARDMAREVTGKPVTCGHELSQALGGPKRALTAVLNARLIGLIDLLITAVADHLVAIGIDAPLMVVRGDGALVSADLARTKPIETILSGPAASVAGASWLTGAKDGLVSDIGGTTTDVCLLQDGNPQIDPKGAQVGPHRTMIEAVAMRTTGLGGDSEVHFDGNAIHLGPRRLMPIALAAQQFPDVVHNSLDKALAQPFPPPDRGRFVIPMNLKDVGLDRREQAVMDRLKDGPMRLGLAAPSQLEVSAVTRLTRRGHVLIAGITPSDASHMLGALDTWDRDAAEKALTLISRQRNSTGDPIASDAQGLARMIIGQLQTQTVDCLLQAAFAEDGWDDPSTLARHPLTQAGLDQRQGLVRIQVALGVPVIGLGASAHSYYGPVGERLGTQMILPDHADVANAIGAVVGQVAMHVSGTVTSVGNRQAVAHLADGPAKFDSADQAIAAMTDALTAEAGSKASSAGVEEPQIRVDCKTSEATIEGQRMFVEAQIKVTASGRPRIARG